MLTLLIGFPVASSDAADWTNLRKVFAILWMAIIDVGTIALMSI